MLIDDIFNFVRSYPGGSYACVKFIYSWPLMIDFRNMIATRKHVKFICVVSGLVMLWVLPVGAALGAVVRQVYFLWTAWLTRGLGAERCWAESLDARW